MAGKEKDAMLTYKKDIFSEVCICLKDTACKEKDATLTSSDVEFVSKTWQAKDGVGGPLSGLAPAGLLVRFLVMKPSNLKE